MNKKEYYIKFINFLIDKGYSENELADKSGISSSTINRAKNGINKLGPSNQKLLNESFEVEKREFDKSQGIEKPLTTEQERLADKDIYIKSLEEMVGLQKELLEEFRKKIKKLEEKQK